MNKSKGVFFTILSAISFGIMPILAVFAYKGNCNAYTLTFLRSFFAIFILYLYLKFNRISLKISKENILPLILLGIFGYSLTTLLLYLSYNYISVGMATTIHFVYPLIVTFICILFFNEQITKSKILALMLSVLGIFLFFENNSTTDLRGVFLSLFSGCTYSFYMIYISKSNVKDMNPFKLTFYLSILASTFVFIFGSLNNQIKFDLTISAWFFSFIVSIITAVVAVISLQIGIKNIGPSTASILSTFEPITSTILGFLILKESITIKTIIGCILIITSVILLTKKNNTSKISS